HDLARRLRGRGLPAVRAVQLLLEPGVRGHDVPAQPVQHDGPDDPHERGGRAAGRAVDRQGAAGAAPAGGRAGRRGGAGHAEDVRDRPELRLADHARRRLPGPGGRGAVVALLLRQPERPGARTDGGRAAGLRLCGPAGDGGHALLPRDRPVQPGAGRQRGGDRRPRRGRARAGRAGLHARYSGGPRTAGRHRPVDREDHGPRLDAHGLPEPVQAGPRRADAVRDQLPAAQPAARADGDGHSGQPRGRAHVERRCGDGERSVLPDRGAARDPRLPGAGLRGLPGLPQGAAERGLGVDRAVRPQERRDRGGHGHGQRDHGGRRRRDRRGHGAPGGSSLEWGQRLSAQMQAVGGVAATPRAPASNLSRATFTPRMLGSDDSEVDMDAPMPPIDPETGTFAGPMPPTDGIRVIVTPIADLVKDASSLTVTIDSIVPGNPSHGDPAKYFLTAEAPAGTQSLVVDMPVGYFGDSDGSNLIPNVVDVVRADNRFGDAFRVDPGPVKLTADIRMGAPDNYYNAGTGRGFVNGAGPAAWNGPRWFVSGGQEPAHPNAGLGDWWCGNDPGCAVAGGLTGGAVPGYDVVLLKAYLTTTSAARALEGVLSTVRRAADIEVTWGSNGQVERVFDLTHKVDVTFNPAYRATYGFLTPESFAGVDASLTPDGDNAIITSSDFECVAPMNELAVAGETDFDNCPSPVPAVLQPAAQIVPISWESGYFAETDAPKNGF